MGTGTPYQGTPQSVRRESTNAAIRDRSFGSDTFQMYFEPSLAEIQSSAVVTDPNGEKSRLPLLQAAIHSQNPGSSILMHCLRVIWLPLSPRWAIITTKGFITHKPSNAGKSWNRKLGFADGVGRCVPDRCCEILFPPPISNRDRW